MLWTKLLTTYVPFLSVRKFVSAVPTYWWSFDYIRIGMLKLISLKIELLNWDIFVLRVASCSPVWKFVWDSFRPRGLRSSSAWPETKSWTFGLRPGWWRPQTSRSKAISNKLPNWWTRSNSKCLNWVCLEGGYTVELKTCNALRFL